ncbi:MAG: aminomethyl-transferring glycine dehydrogenase subunit GcvPB [Clostridia bacterium]
MSLIFEKSVDGRRGVTLPRLDTPAYNLNTKYLRSTDAALPEISELDLVRHYTNLSLQAKGVDNCFYPLGSCTMKYNPKLNEDIAKLKGFTAVHPLQPSDTVSGIVELMGKLGEDLAEITGMDKISLQPAAGAHGEYTSLQLIRKYHLSRGDAKRNKIIVPDSAHGTNPASASMVGFEIINIASDKKGNVDLKALKEAVGDDTAALMLTNPNTLGLLDEHIVKIASIVHKAGGLVYYDGANLNAVMGVIRPGDIGFDVVHLNLHKTFSTPHGGGGPGCGAIGCKKKLMQFLPFPTVEKRRGKYVLDFDRPQSIGKVKAFYGNVLVFVRAYAYIQVLGKDGIKDAAQMAVLNANYLRKKVEKAFPAAYNRSCMHEFVLGLEKFKQDTGVSAMDVAKALIDYGMHPPTMYFPLIVHEALMFEPTETESLETLNKCAEALIDIYNRAKANPSDIISSPKSTPISRPDEVLAARKPIVKYK